ncbi:hypothetical protein OR1_00847 [Geobacter sp. OR-1]|uniref:hypothetical protein n=1 Tax=Geobacter sp. OR-1 TaxID=1266765 RepID=UPI000543A5D8|nr:hypothetical protein [Geobacter sp. OR-1]GAM08575.1 hypothetical protein OR1_00847 [Geobacter sp. OR-1]
MKTVIAMTCILMGLLSTTLFAADAGSEAVIPGSALGAYKGRITLIATKGPKDYDFEMEIMKIEPSTGKVIVKVTSDFYHNREMIRKNCALDSGKTGLAFSCKGENWYENYEVSGDSVKAKATNTKNRPYYISATRVK